MNLKVTVIVPVYNVESYIERCLDSILNQSYENLEIILVNDGSTDSSGAICDKFAKKDLRINVYHQKNKGLSGARNTGLDNAHGDYVAFIDSDDWIEIDMFEVMLNYAQDHTLDIVECDINYTTDKTIKPIPKFLVELKEQAALRILENRYFSVCRRIYRHELIKKRRFIENYIFEDMIFTSDLLSEIEKIGYINSPFYNYFIENDSSIMHGSYNIRNVKSIDAIQIFEKNIMNSFSSKKIISASKKYIVFFAVHHYQKLFEHKNFDKDLVNRISLKSLIKKNYSSENKNNIYTKMARYSPMWIYNIFSKVNEIRSKL